MPREPQAGTAGPGPRQVFAWSVTFQRRLGTARLAHLSFSSLLVFPATLWRKEGSVGFRSSAFSEAHGRNAELGSGPRLPLLDDRTRRVDEPELAAHGPSGSGHSGCRAPAFLSLTANFVNFTPTGKRIAEPHQYFAVTKAVNKIVEATRSNGQAGVVWHTQGAGKSEEMVETSALVSRHPALNNPRRKPPAPATRSSPTAATSWSSSTRRTAPTTTASTGTPATCATRSHTPPSSPSLAPRSLRRKPTPARCSASTSTSTTSSEPLTTTPPFASTTSRASSMYRSRLVATPTHSTNRPTRSPRVWTTPSAVAPCSTPPP